MAIVGGPSLRRLEGGDTRTRNVLVLVHAFPVGVHLFDPQLQAFPRWRVIAPVLPGFDGSERLESASVDGYAQHVIRLLDALGVDRAVFGGVSLGGYVICGVLRQAAERVSAVILADTRSSADTEEAMRADDACCSWYATRDRREWPTRCSPSSSAKRHTGIALNSCRRSAA